MHTTPLQTLYPRVRQLIRFNEKTSLDPILITGIVYNFVEVLKTPGDKDRHILIVYLGPNAHCGQSLVIDMESAEEALRVKTLVENTRARIEAEEDALYRITQSFNAAWATLSEDERLRSPFRSVWSKIPVAMETLD